MAISDQPQPLTPLPSPQRHRHYRLYLPTDLRCEHSSTSSVATVPQSSRNSMNKSSCSLTIANKLRESLDGHYY